MSKHDFLYGVVFFAETPSKGRQGEGRSYAFASCVGAVTIAVAICVGGYLQFRPLAFHDAGVRCKHHSPAYKA